MRCLAHFYFLRCMYKRINCESLGRISSPNLSKKRHLKAIDYQKQGIMYAMKSCETHGFAWVDRPETKEGLIMDCWQSRVKLLTGEAYDRAVEQNELFEKNARPLVPRPQVY